MRRSSKERYSSPNEGCRCKACSALCREVPPLIVGEGLFRCARVSVGPWAGGCLSPPRPFPIPGASPLDPEAWGRPLSRGGAAYRCHGKAPPPSPGPGGGGAPDGGLGPHRWRRGLSQNPGPGAGPQLRTGSRARAPSRGLRRTPDRGQARTPARGWGRAPDRGLGPHPQPGGRARTPAPRLRPNPSPEAGPHPRSGGWGGAPVLGRGGEGDSPPQAAPTVGRSLTSLSTASVSPSVGGHPGGGGARSRRPRRRADTRPPAPGTERRAGGRGSRSRCAGR